MGTSSYVLAGSNASEQAALSSSCHGAGRSMSRHHATTLWSGRAIIKDLANQGIEVRSHSFRGIAEEAPGAYKDVSDVVNSAAAAGLSRKVAKLSPMICVKG
jgi:tRNA-splicing ligase RtcB